MLPLVYLRIIVLQVDLDVWCEACALCSGVTVTYLIETAAGQLPGEINRLSYCETCDQR